MIKRILIGVFAVILAIFATNAYAAIGELYAGGGANFVVNGSELDPITDENHLVNSGVGVEFNAYSFSGFKLLLGLEYGYQTVGKEQELYSQFSLDFYMHTINGLVGIKYVPFDWLAAGIVVQGGAVVGTLGFEGRFDTKVKTSDQSWSWDILPLARVELFLPKSAVKFWQPWQDFNFGVRLESGYLYTPPFEFNVLHGHASYDENLNTRVASMGSFDIQGVVVKGSFVWQF